MAADIQTIRILIGDRKKVAVREIVHPANDGLQLIFQLDMYPLASGAANGYGTGNVRIFTSGSELMETARTVWSGSRGLMILNSGLTAGSKIEANYTYHALSSGELSDFLSGHTGQPYIAASNAALALAGDARGLFMYIMGDKTVDKTKIASDLRALSESLLERHKELMKDSNYGARIFTYKDDNGTYYAGYDTAVAHL